MRRLSIEWPTKGWFSLVVDDFLSLVSGVATCECDLKLTASHAGNSADVFIPLANLIYLQKFLSQRERLNFLLTVALLGSFPVQLRLRVLESCAYAD